jgi:hypothetical protein
VAGGGGGRPKAARAIDLSRDKYCSVLHSLREDMEIVHRPGAEEAEWLRSEAGHGRPGGRHAELDYVSNPAELPQGTLVDLFLTPSTWAARARSCTARHGRLAAISHAELLQNVRAIGAALRRIGLERGDRVGLLSENRPEWAWVDYALLCTGMLTVPLYPTLPAPQPPFILKHSGCPLLFVSTAEQLEKAQEARAELPALSASWCSTTSRPSDASVMTLRDFMARRRAECWPDRSSARKRSARGRRMSRH